MADPATTTSRLRRWSHPSVRVRITLAATLVTAVAVGVVGWLLVRTVEDAQIRRLRDDVDANLDQVATRLQAGDDPTEAVEAADGLVGVRGDHRRARAGRCRLRLRPCRRNQEPAPDPAPLSRPMAMPERR